MKQNENNEMDLLLRALARSGASRSVALDDHSEKHLDADELNSYAEQALPPAARARYTSHLAECANCRKVVSELTVASGINVGEQSVSQKTSAGLWQKLGALFSSGSFRYAVPALALCVVVVVGLVALRQQTQPEFVASSQPAATQREGAIETKQFDDSPSAPEKSAATRQLTDPQSTTGQQKQNLAKSEDRNEASKVETSTDSLGDSANKASALGKAAGAGAQPSYAPEPAEAPPPPKPQTTQVESRTGVVARQKEEADKKKDEPEREQEGTRVRTDDSQGLAASSPARRVERPAAQSEERTRDYARGGRGEKTSDEADLRTISGRRFRRHGSSWIDTAYQQSTATTIVTRGSEQFRALIADEPGIRAIAAQLPGEVVVVWKGRAYRIR